MGDSSAPIVIAKGKGKNAELIIEKVKKLSIGNMQSPIFARALYFTTEIGDEIVSKLYNAVAIALAYIYKIDNGEEIEKPEIDIPSDLIFDENGSNRMFSRKISQLIITFAFFYSAICVILKLLRLLTKEVCFYLFFYGFVQ